MLPKGPDVSPKQMVSEPDCGLRESEAGEKPKVVGCDFRSSFPRYTTWMFSNHGMMVVGLN